MPSGERLIKEKKIKRDKNASIIYRGEDNSYYEKFLATGEVKCIDEEMPFEIPVTWSWLRLKHASEIARGGSPRPIKEYLTDLADGINWIKIGDTEKDGMYINSTKEKIKPEGLSKSRLVHKGDFLLTNSMSFGRPYITNIDGCIHDGWLVISPIGTSYIQKFLFYLLSSGYAFSQFAGKVSGAVVKNLNSDKVADALFPLPPYNEQQRILDKLDELIPKINTYGLLEDDISAMNLSLKPKLRKSILQEAIQGRLVAQDASEEPATILLQRIKEEKLRLVKEGKLKKKDVVDSVIFKGDDNKYFEKKGIETICIDDEIPFEIPSTWVWCRLGAITSIYGGKRIPAGHILSDIDTGHKYIRVSDMKNGTVNLSDIHYISEDVYQQIKAYNISKDDLYITVAGTIGRIGEVPIELDNANLTENADKIVFSQINKKFLMYALQSEYVQSQIRDCTTKVGQPKLAIMRIQELFIALPPVQEQKRIVSKITTILSHITT